MDTILIFLFFYAIVLFVDLIPLIRKKEKKSLYLSIPVFLLTLAVNVMAGLGFQFPTLDLIIKQCLTILHMQ